MQEYQTTPKLNTPQEQADLMRCSLGHLLNLRRRRLIPYLKIGKCVRFDPLAVRKALEKLEVRAR
jgi:hypothetical protein